MYAFFRFVASFPAFIGNRFILPGSKKFCISFRQQDKDIPCVLDSSRLDLHDCIWLHENFRCLALPLSAGTAVVHMASYPYVENRWRT